MTAPGGIALWSSGASVHYLLKFVSAISCSKHIDVVLSFYSFARQMAESSVESGIFVSWIMGL
jgi:hypothetical protein